MKPIAMWWDQATDAADAMAADEVLAEEARARDEPLVRCYGWPSPTLSLGAFQPIAEAQTLERVVGLSVVRRPSGGGAIVHGTDLTYAVALPASHPWSRSPEPLYAAVHAPLVDELTAQGLTVTLHRRESAAGQAAGPTPFFCFSRRSPGDVVVHDGSHDRGKIVGGAQRRLAGVVIQHGSLLLRANDRVPHPWRHPGVVEHGVSASAETIGRGWMERLAAALGCTAAWESAPFAAGREERIAALATRYRESRWLERR